MTVYLVKTYENEQYLHGVFSTEEKARAYITRHELENHYEEVYIEEEEVDINCVPDLDKYLYKVNIYKGGGLQHDPHTVGLKHKEGCEVWSSYIEVRVWARSKEQAVFKATRVYSYVLANGWDTMWMCRDIEELLNSIKPATN